MNYINSEANDRKVQWCRKNFNDEISLEKRLMSMNNDSVYQSIENCVFNKNSDLFDNAKFDGKLNYFISVKFLLNFC